MTRLIFGDQKSIDLRDGLEWATLLKRLTAKVKCPLCKAKVDSAYRIDIEENEIGWNFECPPTCKNSYEYGEEHGGDESITITDLNGKFIY